MGSKHVAVGAESSPSPPRTCLNTSSSRAAICSGADLFASRRRPGRRLHCQRQPAGSAKSGDTGATGGGKLHRASYCAGDLASKKKTSFSKFKWNYCHTTITKRTLAVVASGLVIQRTNGSSASGRPPELEATMYSGRIYNKNERHDGPVGHGELEALTAESKQRPSRRFKSSVRRSPESQGYHHHKKKVRRRRRRHDVITSSPQRGSHDDAV
jgi:hypothetical protein